MAWRFCSCAESDKDCFECLGKDRLRVWIEDFLAMDRQFVDLRRPRVWSPQVLRSGMFVQFVTLCYFEWHHETVCQMRRELQAQDPEFKAEGKHLAWLNHKSVHQQLLWFDVIENVTVSSKVRSRRWNTETTSRDRLSMTKLGILVP